MWLWLLILPVLAVLAVVGNIAAVTVWIPHAGVHGHAPSVLGYVALYCLLAVCDVAAGGWLMFLADA